MDNSTLNISLLYVEDEPETHKTVTSILSRRVATFYSAHNGTDALKLYSEYMPDLVLSDIQMPEMNGLELIDRIKKINPKASIILTTAFTDTSYLLKTIELQVDGFIVKPVRKEILIAAIKKQAEIIITTIFDYLSNLFMKHKRDYKKYENHSLKLDRAFGRYIEEMHDFYLTEKNPEVIVTDYIAGMTDRYAIEEHHKLFDPGVKP